MEENDVIHGRRVIIEILPSVGGRSDPKAVMARLQDRVAKNELEPIDQCWIVVDVDRWEGLDGLLAEVRREGFFAAVSDPCFEIWLQLHLTETPHGTTSREAKRSWGELRSEKCGLEPWPFTQTMVRDAVVRGEEAEPDPHRWRPRQAPGTCVHRLVKELSA